MQSKDIIFLLIEPYLSTFQPCSQENKNRDMSDWYLCYILQHNSYGF